jgi:V8-like Glu-specific endopeptidase
VNACDARDVVALDPTLRDEYTPADRVRDYIVPNDSEIHHEIGAYLRSAVVQQAVHAAMELDGGGAREAGGGSGGTATGGNGESGDPLQTPMTNVAAGDGGVREAMVSEPATGDAEPVDPADEGVESIAVRRDPEAAMVVTAPETALPDVGAASFGPAETAAPEAPRRGAFARPQPVRGVMETVHQQDDRVEVQDTERYPWSATASLLITARDGSQWLGTAWFVSPRTLLTAGHCVYINSGVPGRNGWVLSIQVLPGRNRTVLPFGSATATRFWTVRGWAEEGREEYDYGAVVLPTPLGTKVGSYGFAVLPDDDLANRALNVAGYPGDKPPGTLWYETRRTASLTASKVYYDIDTAGGQSGAPVFVVDGDRRIGVAVHAYGGATTNSGTRISRQVFENVSAWKE